MTSQAWLAGSQPVSLQQPGGLVTLVEGSSFVLSGRGGDIHPESPAGLFALDVRVLSCWELLVGGRLLEPLSVSVTEPYSATFVSRVTAATTGHAESTLLLVRKRWVGSGMREELELRNYADEVVSVVVEMRVASDLADVFAVKGGRSGDAARPVWRPDALHAHVTRAGVRRGVSVTERGDGQPGSLGATGLTWRVSLPAKGSWRTCLEVSTSVADREVPLQYRCGEPAALSPPTRRLEAWRRRAPALAIPDRRLAAAVGRAVDDIGSLIIEDPGRPGSSFVAAGAPWFMALFGRDSLLTSYMALPVDPALAVGVLHTLARLQGTRLDPATEEQPGRILHEVRFGTTAATGVDDGHIYYGTVDATPLFVVLTGELGRWLSDQSVVDPLLPHADRALEWIEHYGDRDGDGYVEYERLTPTGLANQGWKDSWDGINNADGTLASTPIALAEVQGYVYAAYLARADLADQRGDRATGAHFRHKAAELATAFNRDFWLPDRGWFAVALDGAKRPVDSLASNMAHCLWSGIISADRAPAVARRLMSADMSSGWGLRTLASTMARYNPLSYHNGSVWPHDTALAAAGLMRYGFVAESCRLMDALLDASAANGDRLPELYAGLDRGELPVPVAYPTSCSPQAWASAAPLLLLRTMLRLEPRLDLGRLSVSPISADHWIGGVDLAFAGGRLRIQTDAVGHVDVSGLPDGVAVAIEPPRPPAVRS